MLKVPTSFVIVTNVPGFVELVKLAINPPVELLTSTNSNEPFNACHLLYSNIHWAWYHQVDRGCRGQCGWPFSGGRSNYADAAGGTGGHADVNPGGPDRNGVGKWRTDGSGFGAGADIRFCSITGGINRDG